MTLYAFFLVFSFLDRYVALTGRSYALGPNVGRSAHTSRTSSAASSPILRHRNNHRHRIIRFNTRRLIIFHQRITSQNLHQQHSSEIPLVHRDNLLLAGNNQRHRQLSSSPTSLLPSSNLANPEAQIANKGATTVTCIDQDLLSDSSQTKNTSSAAQSSKLVQMLSSASNDVSHKLGNKTKTLM
ncbi:hypothetical protein OUZ56_002404 [Daphnia magna]|uniref:Uncharacterized protein n=1 Tax=Daphnia magna TaxID=35525 RepID=A0ABR0A623_9CRUS|nr:hypothetical protein OUZ56_002404 [Daphnia magna]